MRKGTSSATATTIATITAMTRLLQYMTQRPFQGAREVLERTVRWPGRTCARPRTDGSGTVHPSSILRARTDEERAAAMKAFVRDLKTLVAQVARLG